MVSRLGSEWFLIYKDFKNWLGLGMLLCQLLRQEFQFLSFLQNFPIGILGQVWYLIVSIPDLCTLTFISIFII